MFRGKAGKFQEESGTHKICATVTEDGAQIKFLDCYGAVISYILNSAKSIHILSVISS
jgi:hypothetical protein